MRSAEETEIFGRRLPTPRKGHVMIQLEFESTVAVPAREWIDVLTSAVPPPDGSSD
jgi:hypothetical protein